MHQGKFAIVWSIALSIAAAADAQFPGGPRGGMSGVAGMIGQNKQL